MRKYKGNYNKSKAEVKKKYSNLNKMKMINRQNSYNSEKKTNY